MVVLTAIDGRAQTDVEAGRKVFGVSCAPCHGRGGEGAGGEAQGMKIPDLTRGIFKAGTRDEDLFRFISKGSPDAGMPSFEPLGRDQIWRVVAFVRTLSRADGATSGNAAAGETLFWGKGDCGRCHAVGSRGTSLGPDLTRGRRRTSAQRVRKSIVAPDDEITPGYEIVTIVTRDHKTVSGLPRYFDNFSARIIDSSGNERTYLADEVISMRREMRSLMPGDYGKIFTSAELDDLVAYLMKLRAEASLAMKIVGWALVLASVAGAAVTFETLKNAHEDASSWLSYGRNYAGWRYSPLAQINTTNVAPLAPAWILSTGAPENNETSPLVLGDMMYLTGPSNRAWSVDVLTGRRVWSYSNKRSARAWTLLWSGESRLRDTGRPVV